MDNGQVQTLLMKYHKCPRIHPQLPPVPVRCTILTNRKGWTKGVRFGTSATRTVPHWIRVGP